MEAAIRGALDKAGIPGAQARRRIYDSARAALDRSLERQGIADPARIDDHREKLEALSAEIEAEWAPPSGPAPTPSAEASASDLTARDGMQPDPVLRDDAPVAPGNIRPVDDVPGVRGPEVRGPEASTPLHDSHAHASAARNAPPWDTMQPTSEPSIQPAPAVGPVSAEPGRKAEVPATGHGESALDFAPEAERHPTASAAMPDLKVERPPHIEAPGAKPAKHGKKVKAAKVRKDNRKRPVFASIFSAAVMLSFLGIGVWWLIESGALKSADERDTGVPNPPPSLSRDDFAGGPQPLNPGASFSGEWANVFTPGRDGTAEASSNASVEVIEEAEGNVLRIVSGSSDADGEVRVPLGAEVMQALAGRQSVLALTMRSATPEATQVYVKCEFAVLGDCGRRRFDVTYDTNDVLFSLDYDRALAPNEGGYLVINSDVSGAGKGIDLVAIRIRPLN